MSFKLEAQELSPVQPSRGRPYTVQLDAGCYSEDKLRQLGWTDADLNALEQLVDCAHFRGRYKKSAGWRAYRIGDPANLPRLKEAVRGLSKVQAAP